jgi:HD-like signal output (HDOD) protein
MMSSDKPSPLEQWVERIRAQELPVFNATAQKVAAVAFDERASVSALASIVLQDAALTAKVLRLINSVIFHQGGPTVTTVSRAILLMGFMQVHGIALAVGLIEALVGPSSRQHARVVMTRAFHAAVQARAIAMERRDPHPEDIFIATLLYRVGELAFWCCGGETADELEEQIAYHGGVTAEAEYDVLGFRLFQLTRELAQAWNLHPLLVEATKGVIHRDTREQSIAFGWRIAELAEMGWETDKMSALIGSIAYYVGQKPSVIRAMVYANAREAAVVARDYGAEFDRPLFAEPPETESEKI